MGGQHTVPATCCIPLCKQWVEEPVLLDCSHTFCKKCLVMLVEFTRGQEVDRKEGEMLSCPLCRTLTRLKISDTVPDPPARPEPLDSSASKMCTLCAGGMKVAAMRYCEMCNEYMCWSCLCAHGLFKKTKAHVTVSVSEGMNMDTIVKERYDCEKHPRQEKKWVCTSCKLSICIKCRQIDHTGFGHVIEDVVQYKERMKTNRESLQTQYEASAAMIENNMRDTEVVQAMVEGALDKMITQIDGAYDEMVSQLTSNRDDLVNRCKEHKEKYVGELRQSLERQAMTLACVSYANNLIFGKETDTLLDGQKLEFYDTICTNLKEALQRAQSGGECQIATEVASRVERVAFTRSKRNDEHTVGVLTD